MAKTRSRPPRKAQKSAPQSAPIQEAPQPSAPAADSLAADAADIVDEVQSAPVDPVSPQTIAEIQGQQSGGGNATQSGERDAAGEVWNPEIHAATKARTADGRWRRRRGAGAGPRTVRHTQPHAQGTTNGVNLTVDPSFSPPELKPLAQATVTTLVGALVIAAGPGWKTNPDEFEAMSNAWESFYRAKGITDVPPALMLASTMGMYAISRMANPENLAPLRAIYARVTQRNLPPMRSVPDARPDIGTNGSGKVHVAPLAGETLSSAANPDNLLYDRPERL